MLVTKVTKIRKTDLTTDSAGPAGSVASAGLVASAGEADSLNSVAVGEAVLVTPTASKEFGSALIIR